MATSTTQIRRVAIIRPGRSGFELIRVHDGPEPVPPPEWLAVTPSRGAARSRRPRRAADRPQAALRTRGHIAAA